MNILRMTRDLLVDPRLKGIDINSEQLLEIYNKILQEKPIMKNVFKKFYTICRALDEKFFLGQGKRIEIGSGVSFIKKCYPDIITSDIKQAHNLDKILDAHKMNVQNSSVRGIYGINCFHHFHTPDLFFKELQRVLVDGGGCVLIEPHYGILASYFYKNLHESEHFNKKQIGWNESDINLTGANQALSYIIFNRDKALFLKQYNNLQIVYEKPLNNYLQYFLSGALTFRQLVPSYFLSLLKLTETALLPFDHIFALHHVYVIRKNKI